MIAVCACMCVCVCIHTCTYMHVCVCVCVCVRLRVSVCLFDQSSFDFLQCFPLHYRYDDVALSPACACTFWPCTVCIVSGYMLLNWYISANMGKL